MSYTPSDAEILWDIVGAANAVEEYTGGIEKARFLDSRLLQDGTVRQLEIIGEAARRLSDEFRRAHPEAPWSRIIAMRNILIHAYHRVDLDEVWRVATEDVRLRKMVEPLLSDDDAG